MTRAKRRHQDVSAQLQADQTGLLSHPRSDGLRVPGLENDGQHRTHFGGANDERF